VRVRSSKKPKKTENNKPNWKSYTKICLKSGKDNMSTRKWSEINIITIYKII